MKEIYIERRTENSRRAYFNLAGDWRPRIVVWPAGDSPARDDAWGSIVANALRDWAKELHLTAVGFRRLSQGALTLPQRLHRAFISNPGAWAPATQSWHRLEPDQLNEWQKSGHSHVIYLYTERTLSPDEIGGLCLHHSLDRATLLPYGDAIFQFGIGEATLEICFADEEQERRFRRVLAEACAANERKLTNAPKSFLSAWVHANSEAFGEGWDEF